jgi:hypothetical protein
MNHNTNTVIENNMFDGSNGNGSFQFPTNCGGFNAYVNSASQTTVLTNDIVLTNTFVYQTGPLGNFYQTNSGPLINGGEGPAAWFGLYHYTVSTNLVSGAEVADGSSTVSIGYHYVATDQYGNPLDTDGDGVPDYIEDANGNGTVDSGETDWQNANDPGLTVHVLRPANGLLP